MSRQLWIFALAISLIWSVPVFAQCKASLGTDFQGNICSGTINGTFYETRTGKWINEDDGTFEGTATFSKSIAVTAVKKTGKVFNSYFEGALDYGQQIDSTGKVYVFQMITGREKLADGIFTGEKTIEIRLDGQQIRKVGELITANFEGSIGYVEFKDTTGKTIVFQKLTGREKLADGVFIGDKTIEVLPDGQRVRKTGKLLTADFEGSIDSGESKDVSGKLNSYQKLTGREKLADGVFIGDKIIETRPDGQLIRKTGKLLTADFEGSIDSGESKDVSGKVNSYQKLTGREKLADGYFEGDKIIEIRPDGQLIRKTGKLLTAEFQGTLDYGESKSNTTLTNTFEKKNGTWLVSPTLKLQGDITINVTPAGVQVIDKRKQVAGNITN